MCSHLIKRAISFSPHYEKLALLVPLLRSPLGTQTQTQTKTQAPKELPFLAEYLISSFGFSSDRAFKVAAHSALSAIKSPARPEAVVKFLNSIGLSDSQIKAVITLWPMLLGCNSERTFRPIVHELKNGGCSGELLVQLIRYNPVVLAQKDSHLRFMFWRDLAGKFEEDLLRIMARNPALFTYDIEKHIVPRINLLKECGLSNHDIMLLLRHGTRCMGKKLESLRQTFELIEELGTPRGSKKFLNAVKSIGDINKDTIKRKVELLKETYGWSQEEICSAFTKYPNLLSYSKENLKSKMDFLAGKAGLEISTIASRPSIFTFQLERVLIARYNVLNALKAKGLEIKCNFTSACHMSESRFYENCVVPFEKDLPGLSKAFMAAADGNGHDLQLLSCSGIANTNLQE